MSFLIVFCCLLAAVKGNDLNIGPDDEGTKIFDEKREASPAIWRQIQNVTVNASDTEVISKIIVKDLRQDKEGEVKIIDGGEGHKTVTLELRSPTVLRGYEFQIQVFAVPDKNPMSKTNKPDHPIVHRQQRKMVKEEVNHEHTSESETKEQNTPSEGTTLKQMPSATSTSTVSSVHTDKPQNNMDSLTTSSEKSLKTPALVGTEAKQPTRQSRDTADKTDITKGTPTINIPRSNPSNKASEGQIDSTTFTSESKAQNAVTEVTSPKNILSATSTSTVSSVYTNKPQNNMDSLTTSSEKSLKTPALVGTETKQPTRQRRDTADTKGTSTINTPRSVLNNKASEGQTDSMKSQEVNPKDLTTEDQNLATSSFSVSTEKIHHSLFSMDDTSSDKPNASTPLTDFKTKQSFDQSNGQVSPAEHKIDDPLNLKSYDNAKINKDLNGPTTKSLIPNNDRKSRDTEHIHAIPKSHSSSFDSTTKTTPTPDSGSSSISLEDSDENIMSTKMDVSHGLTNTTKFDTSKSTVTPSQTKLNEKRDSDKSNTGNVDLQDQHELLHNKLEKDLTNKNGSVSDPTELKPVISIQ